MEKSNLKIGIIGGGPSGLFMLKRLVESEQPNLEIHIFERKAKLGAGMPYSEEGALPEHVTNVSDNEIPEIQYHIKDWVKKNEGEAIKYQISVDNFNEYKVLPRLLFGDYLSSQFDELLKKSNHKVIIHTETIVDDVIYNPGTVTVFAADNEFTFDIAIFMHRT